MQGTGSANVSWLLLGAISILCHVAGTRYLLLISEIFSNEVRSAITTIALICLWAANFILVFTFPVLFAELKDAIFYIYAASRVISLMITRFNNKKGQTLEKLEDMMILHQEVSKRLHVAMKGFKKWFYGNLKKGLHCAGSFYFIRL